MKNIHPRDFYLFFRVKLRLGLGLVLKQGFEFWFDLGKK